MSSSSDSFRIVLIFNGRKTEGPRGVIFEGEKRPTRIKVNSTILELYQKICQKLALNLDTQRITMITARVWCEDQYTCMQVVDDEDVEMVIGEFFKQSKKDYLELYVDIGEVEDIVQPMRSVAVNPPHASASAAAPVLIPSVEDEHDPTWVMDEDEDDDDDDENIEVMERLLAENASGSDNDDDDAPSNTQIQPYPQVAESHVRVLHGAQPSPSPQPSQGTLVYIL